MKNTLNIAVLSVRFRKYAIISNRMILDRFFFIEDAKQALKDDYHLYQYYSRTNNVLRSDLQIKEVIQ